MAKQPPSHLGSPIMSSGDVPIIGEDPVLSFIKKMGFMDCVIIARRLGADKRSVSVEYMPFADAITQLGMLSYAEKVATKMMDSQMIQVNGAPDDDAQPECGCGHTHN